MLGGPRLGHRPLIHYFKALFMFLEVLLMIMFKSVARESGFSLAVEGPAQPSPASLLCIELPGLTRLWRVCLGAGGWEHMLASGSKDVLLFNS